MFPQDISERNRDAGDPKGPPNPTSATLAPTDAEGLGLRVMPIGRPPGSPWQSLTIAMVACNMKKVTVVSEGRER
ncbi:MAG: hypothetical protein E6I93_06745 [Chloroflexi bacterium]|nr:MAG: hypothetical protein E6I93_06745 [Chloroflexota bacterium]